MNKTEFPPIIEVTRFEVIDGEGRTYCDTKKEFTQILSKALSNDWCMERMCWIAQDNGKTLKVFIDGLKYD